MTIFRQFCKLQASDPGFNGTGNYYCT